MFGIAAFGTVPFGGILERVPTDFFVSVADVSLHHGDAH